MGDESVYRKADIFIDGKRVKTVGVTITRSVWVDGYREKVVFDEPITVTGGEILSHKLVDEPQAMEKVSIEFHKLLNLQLLAVQEYRDGLLSRSLLASLLECGIIDVDTTITEKKALWPEIAREAIEHKLAKAKRGLNARDGGADPQAGSCHFNPREEYAFVVYIRGICL